MSSSESQLLEREDAFIKTLFPSSGDLWDRIANLPLPIKIPPKTEYKYFAYVCLQDFRDRYQAADRAFYLAGEEFFLQKRLKLNGNNSDRAALHFSRYHFDYGILCLFATINHYISFLNYYHGKINTVEDRTLTVGSLIHQKSKKKEDNTPRVLNEFASNMFKNNKYKNLEKYRHQWSHAGTPLINGELRPRRHNPVEVYGFAKHAIGCKEIRKEGKVVQRMFVGYSEKPEYSFRRLFLNASWLYKELGTIVNNDVSEFEST